MIYQEQKSIAEYSLVQNGSGTAIPLTFPRHLTKYPKKEWLYSQDSYFRESYNVFKNNFPHNMEDFFKKHSFILVRPDAIAKRAISDIADVLEEFEYKVVHSEVFRFNRNMLNDFWEYHLNHAPVSRFPIINLFFADKDCLFLFTKDTSNNKENNIFAGERLSKNKGSTMVAKNKDYHFRTKIKAGNGLYSFIHAPDDPIDFIRELGVAFTPVKIASILNNICAARPVKMDMLEKRLYSKNVEHDLDVDSSIKRLASGIENANISLSTKNKMLKFVSGVKTRSIDKEFDFLNAMNSKKIKANPWDVLTVCAHIAGGEIPGILSMEHE